MREHPEGGTQRDFWQIRRPLLAALLPDLLSAVVGPILIYRLAAPHMPATFALLLAGVPPIIRFVTRLLRHRHLSPLSILSLLTIASKILSALVFKDPRLLLVSDSLIAGVHGVLCLASLLLGRPLLLWIVEGARAMAPATSNQQSLGRWLEAAPRSAFTVLTAIWGVGLLLDAVVSAWLAFTVSIESFMVISPILHYGLLGGVLFGTLLFAWIRRFGRKKKLEETQQEQEAHPSISH